MLDIINSRLPVLSVICARVDVRKKHVLIGCKHDMFCRQIFKVWSRRLLSTRFVFALLMSGGKTRHVWHPIRTCFFVLCPLLDATDSRYSIK